MADGADLDAVVEELLGLALEEFTPRRNAIVRELKARKESALATQVQALRKPSVQLWAVNQLAGEGEMLRAVREAAQAAMHAQFGASADELRAAVTAFDRALDQAARAAGVAMTAGGHASNDTAVQRARDLLRLVARADAETWGLLERGRLIAEPASGGLGAFVAGHRGGSPPASAARREAGALGVARSGSRRETKQRGDEVKRKVAQERLALTRKLRDETRAADQAGKRARELRAQADELAASALRMDQNAVEAEQAAARARVQVAETQRALDALG